MRKSHCILLLAFLLFFGYLTSREETQINKKLIDGVEHIFNPPKPLKGRVFLNTIKVKEIPLSRIDSIGKFFLFTKDRKGNLWLAEARSNRIYCVNPSSGLVRTLGGRGSGPGEFKAILQMGILQDRLWVKGYDKLSYFGLDGGLLEEIRFKKLYSYLQPLDENTFFVGYTVVKKGKLFARYALIDREERIKAVLFESSKLGFLGPKGTPSGGIIIPELAPSSFGVYSPVTNRFYFAEGDRYVIYEKDRKGHLLRVIHREHRKVKVTRETVRQIRKQLLRLPNSVKKAVLKNIPSHFCVFKGLEVLPSGYLAVFRIVSLWQTEMDVFDLQGQFLYTVIHPEGTLEGFSFLPGRLISLFVQKRSYFYREFEARNLLEVFMGKEKR